jgi:glycosyltransferase involved in cell wall biosynthesis
MAAGRRLDALRAALRPAVTLVIPAHNEERRLDATVREYGRAFTAVFGPRFEIVVVANGCEDSTADVARALRRDHPVRLIDISQPVGKGGAILAGFRAARGGRVVFADADGATAASSLLDLLEDLRRFDVAIGSRRLASSVILRGQPIRRRVLGRAYGLVAGVAFGLPIRDLQCGAKAFRLKAARRLARVVDERGWAFDLDLLLSARRLGLSVVERSVVWGDVPGSSLSVRSAAPAVAASLWRMWRRGDGRRLFGRGRAQQGANRAGRPLQLLALNWRCSQHPEAGGAELNLFEQARRWRRLGHEVTVLAARPGLESLPATEVIDGIVIRRMGGRFSVYLHVAWYLLRHGHRYDRVLDISNGIPFFAPLFTMTPATLLVHHVHDRQWFTELPRALAAIGWTLERYLVPIVYRWRKTIAVSPTTRDALIATGFPPDAVEIVYNGVTVLPGQQAADSAEPRRPIVAYVGRIKRYKRLDLLISAFANLLAELPAARLEIAGDGDDRPAIERLVQELHLSDSVTFHGFVDEARKAELLAEASVFATPSSQEGWGLPVIEANVYGVPAVAFDVPGLRSAIVDGETGILAEDQAAFAAALTRILSDDSLRRRMSEAAVLWASRFDWDVAAHATLALLTDRPIAAALPALAGDRLPGAA